MLFPYEECFYFGKNATPYLTSHVDGKLVWRKRSYAFFVRNFGCALFIFTMAVVTNIILLFKEGSAMPDYKQMYLTLLDGVEKALNLLIETQRACEELYIVTDKSVE